MFGITSLEEISGGSFFEVLQSLVLKCIPDGGTILEILSDYSVLFLILVIMTGILLCFFGYRVRRLWTAVLLIVFCGCGGSFLAAKLSLPLAGIAAFTAAAAVLGGLIGYFLWGIGCFLRPFFVIAVSVFAVFTMNGLHTLGLIVGLAAGLIAGIVTAAFYRICLVLYTAVLGGLLAGAGILELFGAGAATFVAGGVFALMGLGAQLFLQQKTRKDAPAGAEKSAKEAAERLKAVSQMDVALSDDMSAESGIPLPGGAPEEGMAASQYAAAKESGNFGENAGSAKEMGNPVQAYGGDENKNPVQADGEIAAAGLCPSCGKPYSSRAKFCMYCGRKLTV